MLEELEKKHSKKIYNILQLRLHPVIIELKKELKIQLKDISSHLIM